MNQASSSYVLGVDGGGTGCRVALVVTATGQRFRAAGGPANLVSDRATAIGNIRQAIDITIEEAGISADQRQNAVGHLGLAGLVPGVSTDGLAQALGLGRVSASDDQVTTLMGAHGPEDGAVCGIGTGSFIGLRHAGALRFLGGWGAVISDQASGAWLGRRLLEETILTHDGLRAPSDLSAETLQSFDNSLLGLVEFARGCAGGTLARLAPAVVSAAHAGDALGQDLMAEGAGYVARALGVAGWFPGLPLALTGGVGPSYAPYLPPEMAAVVRPARGTALDGALALAAGAGQA